MALEKYVGGAEAQLNRGGFKTSKHHFPVTGESIWTVPRLSWVENQIGAKHMVYHVGFLAVDCDQLMHNRKTGKDSLSPAAKYLRKVRAAAYSAAEAGLVHLTQKRTDNPAYKGQPRFEYRASPKIHAQAK